MHACNLLSTHTERGGRREGERAAAYLCGYVCCCLTCCCCILTLYFSTSFLFSSLYVSCFRSSVLADLQLIFNEAKIISLITLKCLVSITVKSEFLNHNYKPSYALMSTISGHGSIRCNHVLSG